MNCNSCTNDTLYIINTTPLLQPRIASLSDIRGQQTYSQYFESSRGQRTPFQQQRLSVSGAPMLVPPQLLFYDQTSGVAVGGSTHLGAGGTVYENPLYHGTLAFAQPSPTNARARLTQCMSLNI